MQLSHELLHTLTLLRGEEARREVKDGASALKKCLTLPSRLVGYVRAGLLSHTIHNLKK